jgi:hypothetical protein
MSYYERHVFFCCNQREPGESCCNDHGAAELRGYAKDRVKALRLVVYPEAVWYTYVDRDDIDEIIDEHLVHGRVVERLKL